MNQACEIALAEAFQSIGVHRGARSGEYSHPIFRRDGVGDYSACAASGDTLLFGCVPAEKATCINGKRHLIIPIGSWRAERVLELGFL
jgi:hypothetical protein